ncbi:MAG: ABC transporter ATP-binding protein/permease [Clostridia bacterium]|nr:ABC transporter ATP-binding protein/permease [Clostridia bacterium]
MLRLVDIVKNYVSGDTTVHALKGVSMSFRKSEFVAILGHSGCGKTTLLNIIGGLDQYTSGDLVINGVSTKEYKDRDWDNYRNHSIGFVFQSYNLIPHQTVLGNVELALTLSGVSRAERKERAKAALEKVGLGEQIDKIPNQLSGGQMQRVAIARALVNDPEIILADEPTGALDTETSVQIMDILKSVSQDRLVIMVTHNPELAEAYSTRIIRLKDGEMVSDSLPYEEDLEAEGIKTESEPLPAERSSSVASEKKKKRRVAEKKAGMTFATAFGLSLRNLFTKKARTFLTAFAGSIGIIGIALILSLSHGFQHYIDRVEAEALSSYPLTIYRTSSSLGMEDLMELFAGGGSGNDENAYPKERKIYSDPLAASLLKKTTETTSTNDLRSFKKWLDEREEELGEITNAVRYGYNLKYSIYTVKELESKTKYVQHYPFDEMLPAKYADFETMMDSLSIWDELVDNQTYLDEQYDVIEGHWPKKYEEGDDETFEVVLSVDKYNRIYDYLLYAIGVMDLTTDIFGNTKEASVKSYSFDDLIGREYTVLLNAEKYEKNADTGLWDDKSDDQTYMTSVLKNGIKIRISGIIRPKEGTTSGSLGGIIGYTTDMTNWMIDKSMSMQIIRDQLESPDMNVMTGEAFTEDETIGKALSKLGVVDKETPSYIQFYLKGFSEKEKLTELIASYNHSVAETDPEKEIRYSDSMAILMSSVNTIINAVSYVLIAFVSISLIVSSIMIGIITYISVLERTKEIGVLRSIGASKRDISRLFDAETVSIGLMSGVFGILITLLLNIPVNLIIYHFTKLHGLALLPVGGAFGLIGISMVLSFIAGFIPSKIAAKKDPVVALRTE